MTDRTRIRRTTGPGLPWALDYNDPARGWRQWSTYNGTDSAAWDAHTIFGAPRPGPDA